jgi:hypothetical protein
MNQSEFIDALRRTVLDGIGAEVAAQWSNPRGRLRSEDRTARALWINGLSAEDRAQAEALAADAAQTAFFGMLCVLDGARVIEEPEDRGHVELFHVRDGTRTLLASSNLESPVLPLHELLEP